VKGVSKETYIYQKRRKNIKRNIYIDMTKVVYEDNRVVLVAKRVLTQKCQRCVKRDVYIRKET